MSSRAFLNGADSQFMMTLHSSLTYTLLQAPASVIVFKACSTECNQIESLHALSLQKK